MSVTGARTRIDVKPMSGYTGAEIEGIDLRRPLDDEIIAEIRSVLLQWRVIFFREQPIGHAEHVAFARRFGELTPGNPYSNQPPEGYPEIFPIPLHVRDPQTGKRASYGTETLWHSDIQAAVNPPLGSVLRADAVPPYGGDTQFTNLVAAYQGMPPPLRTLADELRVVSQIREFPPDNETLKDFRKSEDSKPLIAEHPAVRVHPETGERALWVTPLYSRNIVGFSPTESERILALFFEEIARPQYTVRFRWTPCSVAFWDNRAAAHLGPGDLHLIDFDREMYRVTIVGDVPVGPNGMPSKLISGDPYAAVPS